MNAIAAVKRLLMISTIGLASCGMAEYRSSETERAEVLCQAASLDCSAAQIEAIAATLDEQRARYAAVTSGIAIGGLGAGGAIAIAVSFRKRRQAQSKQQELENLRAQQASQRRTAQRTIGQLNAAARSSAATIEQLNADVQELNTTVEGLNAAIVQSDATIENLQNRLATAQQKHHKTTRQLRDTEAHLQERHKLERQLEGAKSTIEELRLQAFNASKVEAVAIEENSVLGQQKRSLQQEKQAKDREILDLQNQLAIAQSQLPSASSNATAQDSEVEASNAVTFYLSEADFYLDEKRDILLELLEAARTSIKEDTRRYHILQDILAHNPPTGEGNAIAERLRSLLKDYKRMDHRVKRGFAELGFEILEDGKHYKAIYRGDQRYIVGFPKTGSDHRGGRNLIGDIRRRLL